MKFWIALGSGLLTMAGVTMVALTAMMSMPTVDPQQHECLAMNIYHEARGERWEGQIAVAHVTMNRVAHDEWPNNVCDVVYQKKQFSWTHVVKDVKPRERKARINMGIEFTQEYRDKM